MEYHRLLTRQLKRLGIEETLPTLEKWSTFKDIINKTYTENDQERYLLERSMELSSQEMYEINEKLTTAQETADLGYWIYDKKKDLFTLSQTLYRIFGVDSVELDETFDIFLEKVHEEDRKHVKKFFEVAFSQGTRFEHEFRIKHSSGDYYWYFCIGYPSPNQNPITVLTGIMMDITKRKKTEEEIKNLHQQLIDSARSAGMADIASSTLHNVGNVLNSAKVSIELLKEHTSLTSKKEIDNIITLLKKNSNRFAEYIQTDPQGRYVPEYLISLLDNIKNTTETIESEIENIRGNLSHINDIISTQNDISRSSGGLIEKVDCSQILDSSLNIVSAGFERYNIRIIKDYQKSNHFVVDKTKLTQILINLIKNAKESLDEDLNNKEKLIICSCDVLKTSEDVVIRIKDNGIGINEKNMNKIFNLGFTTKPHGHGIGLHMSAIAAKELGGALSVESEGQGKGATFILTLPKQQD